MGPLPSHPSTARKELVKCEQVIARAERYRLAEAQALRTIRERRLYRHSHPTFEEYCRKRWGFSRQHAQQLIDFAEVCGNLSTKVDKLPDCERHARPLAGLTPGQQRRAWEAYLATSPTRHSAAGIAAVAQTVQMSPSNGALEEVAFKPAKVRTPIRWYGGKQILSKRIASLLPSHRIYCEPFAGGAAVLFAKPEAEVETINDVDGELVHFFRVLRDRGVELKAKLELTPFAREEHRFCRDNPHHEDDLERARRFFVRTQQSYAGVVDEKWAVGKERNTAGHAKTKVDFLDEITGRLRSVQIENIDFRSLLKRQPDRLDVVIYADPPYLPEARTRHAEAYRHEMSGDDHCDLLAILTNFRQANVAISGYRTKLYDQRLRGWRRYEFKQRITVAKADAGERGKISKTECVWVNW